MKNDMVYILYALEAIEFVETQSKKAGKEGFIKDKVVRDSILYNLHTLCESTQKISLEVKSEIISVPWRDIADFRNVLVHEYLGLDYPRVWQIIVKYLPELKRALIKIRDRG